MLAWDNGPTNIYYSFTRGFKAGGLSSPATSAAEALRPEKIFSHEIGVKDRALDGSLNTPLSLFYCKNKNLQTQIIDATSGGSRYENAGGVLHYDRQAGYTVANFSGYVNPPGDNLRLGFYMDNAFAEKYAVYRATSQPHGAYYQGAGREHMVCGPNIGSDSAAACSGPGISGTGA